MTPGIPPLPLQKKSRDRFFFLFFYAHNLIALYIYDFFYPALEHPLTWLFVAILDESPNFADPDPKFSRYISYQNR